MSFIHIGRLVTERHDVPTPTDAIAISVTVLPIGKFLSPFERTHKY
jgi:hypothetical protein